MSDIIAFNNRLNNSITRLEESIVAMKQFESIKLGSLVDCSEALHTLKNIRDNGLKVVVFGGFSSGKSTLLNALFGRDLLPVGEQVTTTTITNIRSANGAGESATVYYKNANELAREAFELLREDQLDIEFSAHLSKDLLVRLLETFKNIKDCFTLADDDSHHYLSADLIGEFLPFVKQYLELSPPFDSIALEKKAAWTLRRNYLITLVDKIPEVLNVLGQQQYIELDELPDVLANEAKAFAAKSVDLKIETQLLAGEAQIVDTPGLGSIYQRHTNVSTNYIREASIVLYVLPNRGLSAEDLLFISMLSDRNKILGEDNVFFALNMIDNAINTDDCLETIKQDIQEHTQPTINTLRDYGFSSEKIFPISGLVALLARKKIAGTLGQKLERILSKRAMYIAPNKQCDPHVNLELSGVQQLEHVIKYYLSNNDLKVRNGILIASITRAATKVQGEAQAKQALLQTSINELTMHKKEWNQKKQELIYGDNSILVKTSATLREKIDERGILPSKKEVDIFLNVFIDKYIEEFRRTKKGAITNLIDILGHTYKGVILALRGGESKERDLVRSTLQDRFDQLAEDALSNAKLETKIEIRLENINSEMKEAARTSWEQGITEIEDTMLRFQQLSILAGHSAIDSHLSLINEVAINVELDTFKNTVFTAGAATLVVFSLASPIILIGLAAKLIGEVFTSERDQAVKLRKKIKDNIDMDRSKIHQQIYRQNYLDFQEYITDKFEEAVNRIADDYDQMIESSQSDLLASEEHKKIMKIEAEQLKTLIKNLQLAAA